MPNTLSDKLRVRPIGVSMVIHLIPHYIRVVVLCGVVGLFVALHMDWGETEISS